MKRIFSKRTTWRAHPSTATGLLIDADAYYRAFYEAARHAKRSILLLGWQFDSDVPLRRGDDVPPGVDPRALQLLPFLDGLCRSRPELEVRILAWDHSLVFAFEREVLQKVVFDVVTCDKFHFRFDGTVPLGGSHHQKVAIIDGQLAFTGSADLCHDRWDTSAHLAFDPLRVSKDDPYKPYHEVQIALRGKAVRSLVDLFVARWRHATGEELDAASLTGDVEIPPVPVTLPMPRATVALSRTVPPSRGREPIHELRNLHARAIAQAERLVYIETQYLTASAVRDALIARMKDRARSKLDVAIFLPHKPEKLKEELTVGLPQAEVLETLARVAREEGHAFGVYDVVTRDAAGNAQYVYVHSKLMIVDDRFFTLGSANLTNRSMTIDSELNVSFWAEDGDHALRNAIRRARVRLLLEHVGPAGRVRDVVRSRGLVARLDRGIGEGWCIARHDVAHVAPSVLARAVQDIASAWIDPPPSDVRPSAA